MHCRDCDALLTDKETVRKNADGTYPDLCNRCVKHLCEDVGYDYPDYLLVDDDVDEPDESWTDTGDRVYGS